MDSQRKWLPVRDICIISVFTAIIVVCAQIRIPLGPVPFTLQTWGVALAGLVLGSKKGTLAVLVYIALGAAGVPVFNGFTGGFARIIGHTGGFIVTFPLMSLLAGFAASNGVIKAIKKHGRSVYLGTALILSVGVAANLVAGMLWFGVVMEQEMFAAFMAAAAPFIPGGVLQALVLPLVSERIKAALHKARLLV